MADVELRLVAQTDEYVSGIRQAQQANQNLYNQSAEGAKREKRHIEEIRRSMEQLRIARENATTPKQQELYNKKLKEAKIHLLEAKENLDKYNQTVKQQGELLSKAEKAKKKLIGTFAKLGAAIGGAALIWKGLMGIISSTQNLSERLMIVKEGLAQSLKSVGAAIAQNRWEDIITGMRDAYQAGKAYKEQLIELNKIERSYQIEAVKIQAEMNEARNVMMQHEGKTWQERFDALELYEQKNKELLANELKLSDALIQAELDLLRKRDNITKEQVKLMEKYVVEYANMTENQLEYLREVSVVEKNLFKTESDIANARLSARGDRMREITEQEQERINIAKKARDIIIAGMDEETKALYEMRDILDAFNEDEQKRLAGALMRADKARVEEQARLQYTNRTRNQLLSQQRREEQTILDQKKADLEKFLAEIVKLEDTAEQQRIQQLTGLERIEAEKQYQLKQIQGLEDHLKTLGKLEEEHYVLLGALRGNVLVDSQLKEAEYYAEQAKQREQQQLEEVLDEERHQEALMELKFQVALAEADMLDKTGMAKLKVLKAQKEKEFLFYMNQSDETSQLRARLLNTEIDEIEEQMKGMTSAAEIGWRDYVGAFQMAYNEITSLLSSIFNEQVSHWERERGLLDTRIAETQRAIDQEIKINEQGYASNIEGKKKELAALQAEREKALAQEEEAIKKQRALDAILQTTNLISASANIFKSLSKFGAVGVGIAIATIATMFAAFAKVKVDAAKATKLAKGGSGTKTGMITGKSHAQGGEHFTDSIEVERGENWGVLAANRSKYAETFHSMVDLMNKGRFELSKFIPRTQAVIVNNNDYSRLEDEIKGLRNDMKSKGDTFFGNGFRIEKKGNITRKIWQR